MRQEELAENSSTPPFQDNNGVIGLLEPMKKSMVPVQVQLSTPVVKVASGESAGTHSGQELENLSEGLAQPWPLQTSPASLAFLSPSGNDHLVMLTVDGDLCTLGCGEQGQLGRVPELFANRGGRQGLGRWLRSLWRGKLASHPR